ncbi:hypothetical protein ACFL1H_07505 [Nanoarchaeota archaeon]
MEKKRKCINCKEEYNSFMISNYNLDLCKECFKKFEKSKIKIAERIDKVTHKVTCPKCKKIYNKCIHDQKCETKNCNVWFFLGDLDCCAFARWIDL